ncbi:type II toxin-antitoxin system RelE/ParE family toxin [Nostoc sphaeroides]|uniref:Type II toxin-antitoxin system RelE/ParE family toxin n=1 Tax=Nostoc sphaeroides CCNUC1 TaxID=2653204 RepID=A0A5P8VSK9_9NOSO|nr:type II toxin-antitoxin system RelE/ParE family toxin [Nostoc sphaeroides]MCC5628184.1 type II toxin-antitoxin system RelE/ParE family toxin [Nostoc sphaeroides CHAB 2801]QFS43327.1 type II toxin-antitoxin system RelE/ParE family toxin [Nostoc sphaeroides CCNUC1]
MAYDFHPDAKKELDDAVAYYDNISREMGDAFLAEVELAISRIEQFSEAWTQLSKNTRRCRVASFPYGIIYAIREQQILIVAVMHLQHQPNYWTNRI